MEYERYKIKNDGIDLITDHFSLTKEELNAATTKVNEIFGKNVKEIKTTGRGVAFIGEYNTLLADFTYISGTGQFELHCNRQAEQEIQRRAEIARRKRINEHRKQRKRKLALQRVAAFVLIAGVSIAGVVGLHNRIDANKNNPDNEIVNVVGADVKTINNSDVEIVVEWLDYGMSGWYDTYDKSEYREYVMPQYDSAYESYFIPAHRAYSHYEEMVATELPDDIIGDSKQNALNSVYENANMLNDLVPNSYQFVASPYSKAIVVEMEDGSKEVYIPFDEIDDFTDYSINNLPSDAKLIDGKVYVLDNHLHEVETNLNK